APSARESPPAARVRRWLSRRGHLLLLHRRALPGGPPPPGSIGARGGRPGAEPRRVLARCRPVSPPASGRRTGGLTVAGNGTGHRGRSIALPGGAGLSADRITEAR